jgi:HAD superfamily hydrolase (TIGR01509 family)
MSTTVRPRRARARRTDLVRQGARAAPANDGDSKLRRADRLDDLSSQWRRALDAAQTALQAAPGVLPAALLRGRSSRLTEERAETAHLLEGLAQDLQVDAWLSDLRIPGWNVGQLLGLTPGLRACVFNLEDVLTGSPAVHAAAWAETFSALAAEDSAEHFAPFDARLDYYALVHGRPRLEGVRVFLGSRGLRLPEGDPRDPPGCKTIYGLANLKQRLLLRRLDGGGLCAYAGTRRYLQLARDAGLDLAAVSASTHTRTILDRTGLAGLVDASVDGAAMLAEGLRGQPAPDMLLAACRSLGVAPAQAAAFESTEAGVAAARTAGFGLVVGIGERVHQAALREHGADLAAASLRELLDRQLGHQSSH